MLLGSFLVPCLSGRARLALSARGICRRLDGGLLVGTGHVRAPSAFKELLFGHLTSNEFPSWSHPLVPWIAVSLASSVLGERLAELYRSGAVTRLARELACRGRRRRGRGGHGQARSVWLGLSPLSGQVSSALLRFGQKTPPAPLYLLFYGGFSVLLLWSCLVADTRKWWRPGLRCAEILGEASFFVFVAQAYLLWQGFSRMPPGGPALGLAYFGASTLPALAGRPRLAAPRIESALHGRLRSRT